MQLLQNQSNIGFKAHTKNGQLVQLSLYGRELVHGGEINPTQENSARIENGAWKQADIVAFPYFGAPENLPDDWRFSKKHGLWRFGEHSLLYKGNHSTSYLQKYNGERLFTGQDSPIAQAPFHYTLCKRFLLRDDHLLIDVSVTNDGSHSFPYDIGFHPSFIRDSLSDTKVNGESLDAILDDNGLAFVENDRISLHNEHSGTKIDFESSGFGEYVIWTPHRDSGMVCIEPITGLVSRDGELARNLDPKETKYHSLKIIPKIKSQKNRRTL